MKSEQAQFGDDINEPEIEPLKVPTATVEFVQTGRYKVLRAVVQMTPFFTRSALRVRDGSADDNVFHRICTTLRETAE